MVPVVALCGTCGGPRCPQGGIIVPGGKTVSGAGSTAERDRDANGDYRVVSASRVNRGSISGIEIVVKYGSGGRHGRARL